MLSGSVLLRRPVRIDLSLFSRSPVKNTAPAQSPVASLIAQILELNPNLPTDFLARFSEPALREFLAHLQTEHEPRGRASVWVRRSGRPAMVHRASRDH